MHDSERFRLHFGPYRTPRFHYGRLVQDAVRGEVKIVGLNDAPIPWRSDIEIRRNRSSSMARSPAQ